MMDKVRWGVLGTAKIALRHVLPAIAAGESSTLFAIASRDAQRARTVADAMAIPNAYGSYEALIADPAVEVVYVPLPNDLHVPWTIRALEAGKHVLCEKPIALDAAGARQIAAAAARAGRLVAEAYMIRFHPQWHRVRQIVEAGHLGEVLAIRSHFAYSYADPDNIRNRLAQGGGALYDVAGYPIVAARWLFGTEPQRVIAAVRRDPASGVDRVSTGVVEFPGGRQLDFLCGSCLPRSQRVLVLGTAATLEVETPFNPDKGRATRLLIDAAADLYGGGVRIETAPAADQYARQCEAFARAVRGQGALEFGIDDAIVNLRTLDALFRSECSGRWEAV